MLHIIDQFPIHHDSLAKAKKGDIVILTENAVYAATRDENNRNLFQKTFAHINLCVRKADLLLRNITCCELSGSVTILDDTDYQIILDPEPAIRSWN